MKITDRYQNLLEHVGPSKSAAAKAVEKAAEAGGAAKSGPEVPSDALSVNVSAKAQEISKTRAARVDELRASIANGTFKVDAKAIAAKLVGDD